MNKNDYSSARRAMVEHQVETSGVTDRRLLSVLNRVPRELSVPPERRDLAYSDAPHPLGHGRFLPAPATFARLVQLAAVTGGDRVLDYAPGSGYSTAVLAGMAREVVGLEPDAALAETARITLDQLHLGNASMLTGDMHAPDLNTFDVIVVEGALDQVPEALLERLAPSGRLVCLLRRGPTGIATEYVRAPEGFASRAWFNATLPPLATGPAPEIFVF